MKFNFKNQRVMKKLLHNRLWLVLCGLILSLGLANAQITSKSGGQWNNTNTWTDGIVPTESDDVIIQNGHNVEINADNLACNNLTVNSGGTIRMNSANRVFTINGNFTNNGTWQFNNNNAGTYEIFGNLVVNNAFNAGDQQATVKVRMRGEDTSIGGTALSASRFGQLEINLPTPKSVLTLEGNIQFANVNTGTADNAQHNRLTLIQGIVNAQGNSIIAQKSLRIIVNANAQFASPLTGCDYTEADPPVLNFNNGGDQACCGSAVVVEGTIAIKDFLSKNDGNIKFPANNATVYVFGTFNRINQIDNSQGTFIWGPNSWYKATNTNGNQPNGVYAATGGTTKTTNDSYETPAVIQSALDACLDCTLPDQTLTVSAEDTKICENTATNIQVQNSERNVLYSLFAGNLQVGEDVVGDGGTISLPTGNLVTQTIFTVKTSEANDAFCPGRKIGENVTVSVVPVSVAGDVSTEANTIGDGKSATINLTNYTGDIQWQSSDTGAEPWNDLTGKTQDVLVTDILNDIKNYYFRAAVTNDVCDAVFSSVITIIVVDKTTVDEDANATCNGTKTDNLVEYWTIQSRNEVSFLLDDGNNDADGESIGRLRNGTANVDNNNARWIIESQGGDQYRYKNLATGRYITSSSDCYAGYDGTRNSNTIQLTSDENADNRNFGRVDRGDGYVSIRSMQWDGGNHHWNIVNRDACGNNNNNIFSSSAPENNNNYHFQITHYPYVVYSDIVITDLVFNNPIAELGNEITGKVELKNIAPNGTVEAGTAIKIKLAFNGQYFYTNYTGGLEAGATVEVPFAFTPNNATDESGESVELTVNSDFSIDELNCGNNEFTSSPLIVLESLVCNPIPTDGTINIVETEICEGVSTTITLSTSLTDVTYKLYLDGNLVEDSEETGDGENIEWTVGEAGKYSVKAIGDGTTYCDMLEITLVNSVTLSFKIATEIKVQPVGANYALDEAAEALTVTAVGENLSYQWYKSEDNANDTPTDDEVSATPATDVEGTFHYYVVVTGDCGVETSDVVTVVVAKVCDEIEITSEPVGANYELGDVAEALTVVASGDGLTYQWYVSNNGEDFDEIEAENNSEYTPVIDVVGTLYYYVEITDECANMKQSATVVIEVSTEVSVCDEIAITTQPQGDDYEVGDDAETLSVVATGTGLSYQWYCNEALIPGEIQASYEPSTASAGTFEYYVLITDECGETESSNVAVVEVSIAALICEEIVINIHPVGAEYTEGDLILDLFVDATGTEISHQWYLNGQPIEDANGESHYPLHNIDIDGGGSFEYTVEITDRCGNTFMSNAATVVVSKATSIGEVQADGAVIVGYYDILGRKLTEEPRSGIFIIQYDNGTAEKVVK
jgi:hypothetical protein